MAIVINGSGTVTGLAVGGLPDGTVDTDTLANTTVTAAKVAADVATQAELDAAGFNPDAAVVFNESGANVDFRVESDNNANMLFVDGGANAVGIGNAAPESPQSTWSSLQVGGQTILQGINSADPTGEMELGYNVYRHTDGSNRHIATGAGAKLYMCTGAIRLYVSNGSQNADTSYTMMNPLTINNNGRVEINPDGLGTNFGGSAASIGHSSTSPILELFVNHTSAFGAVKYMNGNGEVGSISITGSGVTFNTSSDYRLKENVDYTWDATTRLKQLKPARFNFIADDTNTPVDGFIAHEVSSVVPEAVSGVKDAMNAQVLYAEGDEIPEGKSVGDVKTAATIAPQGIDQSKLVPLLVKTIQELEARITALEA